ncbi:MAG: ABC transporter permease subunit, partial [Planctomycetota bacterium]|nr:ABC transporter permease subunit [Planctomycetota bacterium]
VGPVFSAGSITQERERKTLGLLLTTLLRPGTIIRAKLLAALRVSTVLTFLLTEQLLLAYVLVPNLQTRFWTLPVYLLIIATTCLATTTTGLMCSALSRKTSVAIVTTYLVLFVLFVGPVGLKLYMRDFVQSVSESKLSAMTISSPYAAALSIVIPPDKSSMVSTYAAETTPPVRFPDGIAIPVWGMFLMLYPLLSGVFYVIAYVAFRYRWWRAGGTS